MKNPTIENLPTEVEPAARKVFEWLAQTRTGFEDQEPIAQIVDVEIYLQAVIRHPAAIEDSVGVRLAVYVLLDEKRQARAAWTS